MSTVLTLKMTFVCLTEDGGLFCLFKFVFFEIGDLQTLVGGT